MNTHVQHHYLVQTSDLNHYGIMHGGRLLTICDEVAYMSAHTHAGCICLTRAVHQARFHTAAQINEKLIIHARVGLTGYSSLWVEVDVKRADQDLIMDAVFVFAAIDEQQKAKQVPRVLAVSDAEKLLQSRLEAIRKHVISENQ